MAVSPLDAVADVVTMDVKVDGNVVSDQYLFSRLEVISEINRVPLATILLEDGDPSTQSFDISDSDTFVPGAAITIEAGYDSKNKSIFSGIVVRHGIQVHEDGRSYLSVTCADKAIGLTVARRNRQFANSTDSAVLAKIIRDGGLTADVSSTSVSHEYLVQYYATDWDYLLTRAEANGLVVTVSDGKVTVGAPKFGSPVLTVGFGESIARFDGTVDSVSQLTSVSSSAWDPGSQQVTQGASSEPSVNSQGNLSGSKLADVLDVSSFELQTLGTASADELKAWSNGALLKSRLAKVQGKVTFPGSALAEPGTTITLSGLGARMDGDAYISAVRHVVSAGRWRTEVGFGLPNRWFAEHSPNIQTPSASGMRPGTNGLQIAKVKQVYDDPEGQRRILVTWPLMGDGGSDGIWVRIVSPYASNNAGIVFLPEVGDEVVLGFLGDDPTAAIVLGSLHSSQLKTPIAPDEKNTNKGIVTRSELKMTFDDEKKVTVISTPGGHVVTLSDDAKEVTVVDSNSNKFEMTESGISMTSPKDITIKADQKVSITGTSGVDISSTSSVSVKGMNVSVDADTSLSASGGADASFSSSGSTSVKGSMVMIN